MLDLSQFGTVAGLAVVTAVVMQVAKGSLPDGVRPFIPWIAMLFAVGMGILYGLATGQTSIQALASLAMTGVAGALSAVGGYQATLGALPSKTP